MTPLTVSFRYSEVEYVHAMRAHYAKRLSPRRDFVVIAACLVIGVLALRYSELNWLSLLLLGSAFVLAAMLIAAFTVLPRLTFRREPKFRDEYRLTFTSEGIHFRTENIDSNLKWDLYSRVLTTPKSWILYYGKDQFTVIPKRAFASDEEKARFNELLFLKVRELQK
jgi:hypothetical protein